MVGSATGGNLGVERWQGWRDAGRTPDWVSFDWTIVGCGPSAMRTPFTNGHCPWPGLRRARAGVASGPGGRHGCRSLVWHRAARTGRAGHASPAASWARAAASVPAPLRVARRGRLLRLALDQLGQRLLAATLSPAGGRGWLRQEPRSRAALRLSRLKSLRSDPSITWMVPWQQRRDGRGKAWTLADARKGVQFGAPSMPAHPAALPRKGEQPLPASACRGTGRMRLALAGSAPTARRLSLSCLAWRRSALGRHRVDGGLPFCCQSCPWRCGLPGFLSCRWRP